MAVTDRTVEGVRPSDAIVAAGVEPDRIAVENPATGEIVGHATELDAGAVADLIERARAAQPAWDALGFKGRAAVMRAGRKWLVENRARMVETIVAETGKPRDEALLGEVFVVADALGFWARKARPYLADTRVRSHSPLLLGKRLRVSYRPHGVVAVIGPWNFPLTTCFGDAIPALMAGNCVVLKPSEHTPLANLLMAEGMRAAGLPEGVLQVATGRGKTGAALVEAVDMVMFTGSTATGKRIMARAAERLVPVSLELGGKDPMIVCDDANVERAANAALYYGMMNSGQVCQSVERVYVEEPVYDAFVERVVEGARRLRQGAPGDPGSIDIGAMTFPPQIERIERHLRDAVEKGATVLTGGAVAPGPGRFFEPTVVTGVDHSMELMTEETFGPVLPIMKVRDAEEGLRLANDTRYGLNSSVWTRDQAKGRRLARRIEAGNVCVNDCMLNAAVTEMPFSGSGESGLGARNGREGIRKYCQVQSFVATRFGAKRDPHFYPYAARSAALLDRLVVLMFGRGRGRFRR